MRALAGAVVVALAVVACGGADDGPLTRSSSPGTTGAPSDPSGASGASPSTSTPAGTSSPPASPSPPPSTSSCPWGAQVTANATVGLASSSHVAGGNADERKAFDKMNLQRTGTKLVWDDCLADLARSHSQDMIARGYYGHGTAGDPQAFMVFDRAKAAALPDATTVDEDVLMGDLQYFLHGDASTAVDYWMTDGHKLPILGCAKVGVGIASATTPGGTATYVTADFSGCH